MVGPSPPQLATLRALAASPYHRLARPVRGHASYAVVDITSGQPVTGGWRRSVDTAHVEALVRRGWVRGDLGLSPRDGDLFALTDEGRRVAGEAAFVVDGSAVRLLWPVRCLLAREPERPIAPGLPSLSAIIRQAVG